MHTRDEFIAALAHELRGPLAPLRNSLDLAQSRQSDDPLLVSALSIADRQVSRMTRLVDDLLDIGRVNAGQLTIRREPVVLADVLARSMEAVRPLMEERRHHLLADMLPHVPTLWGDADRLIQVFSNLLTNAAKYTPDGGHVAVALGVEGGDAVIQVQDTGIGLEADQCNRVFDLFSRVREAQYMPVDGLGIGLALARYLIEQHGGTITAFSRGVQRGTCFTVRLPLRDAPAEDDAAHRLGDDGAPAPMRRRVLVVDDHVDSTETLSLLLDALGHEPLVANTGASALHCAAERRPDLILLDLGLPDLDGCEVARLLRLQPDGPSLRIVALTGWGQPEDRARTAAAGFDGHLVKPLSREALESLLAALADVPDHRSMVATLSA